MNKQNKVISDQVFVSISIFTTIQSSNLEIVDKPLGHFIDTHSNFLSARYIGMNWKLLHGNVIKRDLLSMAQGILVMVIIINLLNRFRMRTVFA